MPEKLLSISQFAKILGTTRRTLIFYDQKGIFKPAKTADNGYRYYSYKQAYQLGFIFSLRDLGLSVSEIKDYLNDDSSDALNKKLIPLKSKIERKINNLQRVLEILNQKEADNTQLTNVDFYVVKKCYLPERKFWCSDFKVDCSEEQIAKAYSNFYWTVGAGVMTNKKLSGFLTDLPQAKANSYANAGFRLIKEESLQEEVRVPVISQQDGDYLIVKVKNDNEGIEKGLAQMRKAANKENLQLGDELWQFNLGLNIKKLGLTDNSILAYEIL